MTTRPASRLCATLLALAAANGLMAVVTGAFGAHAAQDPTTREWLRTGAQYQLGHAVGAIAVLASTHVGERTTRVVSALFGAGALVFAGSLDALALTHVRFWGAVTPLGGLLMIAGWATLALQAWRSRTADR